MIVRIRMTSGKVPTMEPPRDLGFWQVFLWYLMAWLAGCVGAGAGLVVDHQEKPIDKKAVIRYFLSGTACSMGVTTYMHSQYGFSPLMLTVCIFASFKAVDVLTAGTKLFRRKLDKP